jgi:hypothetical protein
MGFWDISEEWENTQARPHFSKFKNMRRSPISKLEERWRRINFFSTKHTSILSETALDEYSFIIPEILGILVYGLFFPMKTSIMVVASSSVQMNTLNPI